jgi:endothelin-converting enzyme/putative endopeptidase
MRIVSLSLFLPVVVLASACSSNRGGSEEDATLAADLASMMPGVDPTALDRTVDPCQDFYQFACGGYIASLPADTQEDVRSFTALQTQRSADLQQVLTEAKASPQSDAEAKAGALYASCLTRSPDKFSLFAQEFRRDVLNAVTTRETLAAATARLHRRGIGAFFVFFPGPDMVKRGRHGTADATPEGFDFGTDYADATSNAKRAATLMAAVKAAEPLISDDDAKKLVASAMNIEQALADAASKLQAGQGPSPTGRAGLKTAAPAFAWPAYFLSLGKTNLQDFLVDGLPYFAGMNRVLEALPLDDARAYLIVRWYEGATIDANVSDARRPRFCANVTAFAMSDALEARFNEVAGVDATAQRKARVLFGAIVDAFDQELQEEAFLDTNTRIEAQTKLSKMRGAIGASRNLDGFADVTVNADDAFAANWARLSEHGFDLSLSQIGKSLPLSHVDFPAEMVNASYDPSLNKINVPGGILGGYFFSPQAKNVANFSGIGAVLGHEITHGFDNDGRQVDGDGVQRDWWSPVVAKAFGQKAQCLADEYSAFAVDGVPDPTTGQIPAHVDGQLTLPENIADNGGVKIAFRASGVETKTKPIVEGFTPAQQFFVGYAQLWCSKMAPQVASGLLTDVHSPPKARVNLPLANFNGFATAFKCGAGTPMAPANRCGVW